MWMSSHKHTSPLFSSASLCSPTKERLAAIRGTAHGRHTDLGYVPLLGTMPRDLCLKDRTVRSCQSLPVLQVVESFPGHRLLLGQRSRINFFSHDIGSLLHQDH